MKKLFISMSIAAIFFAGCSGNKTEEHNHNDGTHQHDDGSVHQNHEDDTAVKQEEFTAPVDTASQKEEAKHEHTHDEKDEHEHPHKH
jgi:PBP1b-binding outer membrane lipoprotein LpoB